jgi:peptidoglycan/LPS O-acetylase OafA/YrhL
MTQTDVSAVPALALAGPRPRADAHPAGRGGGAPFRHDIEGLRGIAVLLVVGFHAGLGRGWTGGFVGVDVFFVLSGYLITGLLVQEIGRTGRLRLREFYARRVRRLLPASALVLVATLVAAAVLLSPLEQRRLSGSALATAGYASNLWFMRRSTDYFAVETETNPLLHTWSLAIEEQFYLVWPLLLVVALGAARRRGRLAGWIGVLSLVSLAGCIWLTGLRRPWAFFGTPARAWEFGLGALLCMIPVAWLHARPRLGRALGWAGLVALAAASAAFSDRTAFPGYAALLPACATGALLLAGAAAPGTGASRVMEARALQFLGRHSYSWYLWHWPLLAFAAALAPTLPMAGRLVCAVAALGMAAVTYRLVEVPIRFHPRLAGRPGVTLACGALLTAVALSAALASRAWAAHASAAPAQQRYLRAAEERSLADGPACLVAIPDVALRECVGGDTASARVVVLFGDSHAAQWFAAVEPAARRQGWRLVTLVKAACPAPRVALVSTRLGRAYDECDLWRQAALARIAALRPAAVLASSSSMYVRGGAVTEHSQVSAAAWQAGWAQTLGALRAAGAVPVLVHDSPQPAANVPTCLSRAAYLPWHAGAESCGRPRTDAVNRVAAGAEAAALAAVPGTRGVDFSDLVCGADVCEPVRGGQVVYRDESHLAAAFAASLAPAVGARLASVLAAP